MKEPHVEDLASHNDPESCVRTRKGTDEALTGARIGRVLSREIKRSQGADDVSSSGRQHEHGRYGKRMFGPARSETPRMCGNSMRENREIPRPPCGDGPRGRIGKAGGRKPMMYGHGKSDRPILPAKPPNKVGQPIAEAVEGRGLTKGNMVQQNTHRTQGRSKSVPNALDRVREAAVRNKRERFTALLHHITIDRLRAAFHKIKRNAKAGIDGVTWKQYEEELEANLVDLHARLHCGAYRAKPSRRAYLPKPDGGQRPLGVASLEDKILQRAVVEVLNAIYEVDFLGFSYGFRPERRPHEALDALAVAIRIKKVSWVLDADIHGFFDTINHEWLMRFLRHRIADKRILRLIKKWLKAGVIEDGKWSASDEGSPQGASISPLLSNIYLHYVLDLWAQQWRKRYSKGEMIIVRWADDFIVGFQYQDDAQCFLKELRERFCKFSLQIHPQKTRLIRFGRFARRDCRQFDGRRKPETFNFLGFTHMCGVSKSGKFMVVRRTRKDRLRDKLRDVKTEMKRRMHHPIPEQGAWLRSVVLGYFGYHAIAGNGKALCTFRTQVARQWYRTLRRRSQKSKMNWERMSKIRENWLPPVRILHPWPEQRFFCQYPR